MASLAFAGLLIGGASSSAHAAAYYSVSGSTYERCAAALSKKIFEFTNAGIKAKNGYPCSLQTTGPITKAYVGAVYLPNGL